MCIAAVPAAAAAAGTTTVAAGTASTAASIASFLSSWGGLAAGAGTAGATTAGSLAAWIGANASAINTGLAVANAVGLEYGQYQAARAQGRAIQRTAASGNISLANQYAAQARADLAEEEATTAEVERLSRETRGMAGSAIATTIERGASGGSLDALLGDFELIAGTSRRNARRSLELSVAARQSESSMLHARQQAGIGSMQVTARPSVLRLLLNAGVGGFDAYSKYLPPKG